MIVTFSVVAAAVTGGREIGAATSKDSAPKALGTATTGAARTLPFWQRGFFDRIIRNSESYSAKWDYVCENPVRAGLIQLIEKWPFQGEIVSIEHR
jgi:hypothetical protein